MNKFGIKFRDGLARERLAELLSYDPLTGLFTWVKDRKSYGGKARAGSVAGQIDPRSGHRLIGVDGKLYFAHRLAWLYMTGKWPDGELDHKDMAPDNNVFDNLREIATKTEQRANQRVRRDSQSGVKGVRRVGNRWMARIRKHGVQYELGRFDTIEQAHAAYAAKAVQLFGEFARPA